MKTYLDISAELEKRATEGPWELAERHESRIWKHGLFDGTNAWQDARLIAFHRNIAPEVRAVVKAAHHAFSSELLGFEGRVDAFDKLKTRLDALDAKARELAGGGE